VNDPDSYDIVVVGARCAGAPTAMLAARRGYRVLLLDRSTLPSDTLSTHYIHATGLAHLRRWGLLDALAETGCPRIERMVHQVADVRLTAGVPADGTVTFGYAPRRRVLDGLLLSAAIEAGAQFTDGSEVINLLVTDGRVHGVTYRDRAGRSRTVQARLVVGADGMRSTVARLAGAAVERADPVLKCTYYTYWSGVNVDFELYERSGRLVGALPTNDGLVLVGVCYPIAEFPAVRRDALASFEDALRTTAPDLAQRLAHGERVEHLRGTRDERNFFRRATGPGWALVGDAGYHRDSITARGITDAFEQAAMLDEGAGPVLHDQARLDDELRRYAERRNRHFLPLYETALANAVLEVSPQRLGLLRFLATRPDLTERYFAVGAGLIPAEELYNARLGAEVTAFYAGSPR
jgi:flavin-dependent dehydrogenase